MNTILDLFPPAVIAVFVILLAFLWAIFPLVVMVQLSALRKLAEKQAAAREAEQGADQKFGPWRG